jgi:glycosyltransferase involved in cell wall biosynthesis
MYNKDPVPEMPFAHREGWFTEETTVPLPQYDDAAKGVWIEQQVRRVVLQKSSVQLPTLHHQVQESINSLQNPVVSGYRRTVSENAETPPVQSRRLRMKKTLVAIPCFNEEVAIGSLVLMAKQYVDEVLVIDDGCTDNTVRVARDAGATVVSHGSQMGKGRGIKNALRYAFEHHYDALVFMDGDGQHNPAEIPLLLEPILADSADLVIGFRSMNQMPVYRRFGRTVLDIATGAGSAITDSQCGFRALNRRSIESMLSALKKDDFSTESEMLQVAQEKHLRVGETPINCKYGDFDTSTQNPISHGIEVLGSIFWLIVEKKPLYHIGMPGLVAMFIGIFLLVRFLQIFNEAGLFSIEYGLAASLFLIPGAIGLVMGMMLALIARLRE